MDHSSDPQTEIFYRLPLDERARAWRVARDWAHTAYQWWSRAPVKERQAAYAVYLAAEDQEAAAAEHLRLGTAAAA
jgi:hypothetical protein